MRDNKALVVVSGFVVLGSVLLMGWSVSGGFGPHLEEAPFRELGRVLAQQTVAHLKPGGTVTVITRDTVAFENPASDVLLASFRRELSKTGFKIDTIQSLQVDPLRPVAVPAGDFCQWIKSSAKGSVIVSFMGPPLLNETQLAQLGQVKPAIIALCSRSVEDQVDLRALFTQGLLQGAVVSKRPALVSPGRTATDREAFERQFVEVTSENLAVLSSRSNPSP